MSVVNVRVRISELLTERRYAVCVRWPDHAAWVLPLGVARKLHNDLGEAIQAVERLSRFSPRPALAGEPVGRSLSAESRR